MTLSPAKLGGWAFGEKLTSAQMNSLQSELLKALDGENGGTYSLQSDLILDGPAAFHIAGEMEVDSGATLNITGGAMLFVGGTLEISSPANLLVSGDIEVLTGGDINVQSGGEIAVANGGVVNFASSGRANFINLTDLRATSAAQNIRHTMAPMHYDTTGWNRDVGGGFYKQISTASGYEIAYVVAVDEGDVINQIRVQLKGGFTPGHGALPAVMPVIRLIRADHDAGTFTTLAFLTDPSASQAAYDVVHNVSLNSTSHPGVFPYTQDGRNLMIQITGESGANSVNNTLGVTGIFYDISANHFRAPFGAR